MTTGVAEGPGSKGGAVTRRDGAKSGEGPEAAARPRGVALCWGTCELPPLEDAASPSSARPPGQVALEMAGAVGMAGDSVPLPAMAVAALRAPGNGGGVEGAAGVAGPEAGAATVRGPPVPASAVQRKVRTGVEGIIPWLRSRTIGDAMPDGDWAPEAGCATKRAEETRMIAGCAENCCCGDCWRAPNGAIVKAEPCLDGADAVAEAEPVDDTAPRSCSSVWNLARRSPRDMSSACCHELR